VPWLIAAAVVGMARATRRPPSAWLMSAARTPAATETIKAWPTVSNMQAAMASSGVLAP
jgi:hypothetical protein